MVPVDQWSKGEGWCTTYLHSPDDAWPLTELAEQIEKIVGDVFAQGFVIDRAQRTTDDIGLVVPAILAGPSATLVIVGRTA